MSNVSIKAIDKFFETNSVMTRSEWDRLVLKEQHAKANAALEARALNNNPKLTLITLAAINSAY